MAAPRLVETVQGAFHLLQSQPSLLVGLGRHQVGDAFRRGEVELAVLEGPAGEFARFGEAAETQATDRRQHRAHHGAPAMQMQLGHHLAGLAVRRLEADDQAAIDLLGRRGIADRTQRQAPRRRRRLASKS